MVFQDRGPVFKLGTIDVYIRPLLKMQSDLEPLSALIPADGDTRSLQIPGNPKQQKGWDVEWYIDDDVALLRGVYRYGLGSWEAIKMDPDYGLVDKVIISCTMKRLTSRKDELSVFCLIRAVTVDFVGGFLNFAVDEPQVIVSV